MRERIWMCACVVWWLAALPLVAAEQAGKGAAAWQTRDGLSVPGDLTGYSWTDRSLLLRAEAGQAPLPLSAQDLNLRGKVQLLFAEPFQETVLAHRAELNSMPGVQAKVEQLKTAAVVLTGVSIAVWLALSWFFAGAILRKPQMRYWIACLLGAAILTSLTGWAISESLARFPTEKAQQISGVVLGASAVLLVFMVWGISRSGLVRSTIWCGLAMVSAAVVPPLVVAAALASNVYFYSHALNEAAADKYLSEVWLIPMGVI